MPRGVKMMKLSYTTAIKIHHLRSIANYLLIFAILSNLLYVPCYFYMRQINRSNIIVHYQENLNSGMQIMDASIESAFAFILCSLSIKKIRGSELTLYKSNN